jgi:hypothetical protein
MLIVGARRQTAFRAFVSSASSRPASSVRGLEKVAPIHVALGRADAGANGQLLHHDNAIKGPLTHVIERPSSSTIRSIGDLDTV